MSQDTTRNSRLSRLSTADENDFWFYDFASNFSRSKAPPLKEGVLHEDETISVEQIVAVLKKVEAGAPGGLADSQPWYMKSGVIN